MSLEKEIKIAKEAALQAGEKILRVYNSDDFQIQLKGEDDPVGLADKLSNTELCKALHKSFPKYGILSEESIDESAVPDIYSSLQKSFVEWKSTRYTWMIDPLDGTKDFIKKTGDFGIHIGLTKDGQPVLGVNYYPTKELMYFAIKGEGAYKESDNTLERLSITNKDNLNDAIIVTSRSNPDDTLRRLMKDQKIDKFLQVGGMGLKICKVAEGSADLYLLFNHKSSLWDSCSSQIILEEAGGKITDLYGNPINYRPQNTIKLDKGIIAANRNLHNQIIEIVKNYDSE